MIKVLQVYCEIFGYNVKSSTIIKKSYVEMMRHFLGVDAEVYMENCLDEIFASFFINIDAGASIYHTELDDTYTLIHVPCIKSNHVHDVKFQYKISSDVTIELKMSEGINFLFSGYMLTYWQKCTSSNSFINLSGYTSRRFIQHMNKSFKRLEQNTFSNNSL